MKPHRTIAIILFSVILAAKSWSADLLDTKKVFSGETEVCLSDGSSLYVFHPKGTFTMEPLGISGRTIEGLWKYDSNGIRITGTWSWINGLSVPNDRREMDLHIGAILAKKTKHRSRNTGKEHEIQEAYFLIDRLEKIN